MGCEQGGETRGFFKASVMMFHFRNVGVKQKCWKENVHVRLCRNPLAWGLGGISDRSGRFLFLVFLKFYFFLLQKIISVVSPVVSYYFLPIEPSLILKLMNY